MKEIELLDKELYSTLHWNKVCDLIHEYNYDLIIDLGPGNAMIHFLNENAFIDELISCL
ncbi:MAG: hypothetical protein QM652_00555 [Legionella sp.]|uniref:hypothetical protein n=1 Tax=Legionella sp. TaxID=459 RepID=UPI0039E2A36A